jgi:uncharacterized peroxidase-related enzyme
MIIHWRVRDYSRHPPLKNQFRMLPPSPAESDRANKKPEDSFLRNRSGREELPNFLGILTKSPAAATGYLRMKKALAAGLLSERHCEQIALAVAEINGAKYCLHAHSAIARNAGLTEDEIQSARRSAAPDPKSDRLLRFTQSMVLQRGEISDEDLSALRQAGCSDAEIIEIVAHIALNIFTNYLNILSKNSIHTTATTGGQPACR